MNLDNKLFNRTYLLLTLVNLITAFGFSMIATIVSSYAVTLGAGLTLAGTLAGQLSLQSACIKKVDVTRVGVATSTYYIGADIGQGLGPMFGGRISELFNYKMMFCFTGILMLVGIIVFIVYQINDKRELSNVLE